MGILLEPDTPDTRRELNQLARMQTIVRLEQDVLFDMHVCDIEGWDKLEFIRQLQELLDKMGGKP